MRRIVLANLKGGASKTTTACALAVGLARRGLRTLLVDCDASANATWTLTRGRGAEGPTLAHVLTRQAGAEEAIRPTDVPALDLLPASADLAGANVALVNELGRDVRLRSAMAALASPWSFVVLDTPPTMSTLLVNALVYAEEVIVPVDAGLYGVLGLVALEQAIAEVRDAYSHDRIRLAGLLLTRVAKSNVHRDVEAEVRARFGPLVHTATIPASAKVEEATTRGLTVLEHAPTSPASIAYAKFIGEVVHGIGAEAERGGDGAGRSARAGRGRQAG